MYSNFIGIWCNGNTDDFDSSIHGSSPCVPATIELTGLKQNYTSYKLKNLRYSPFKIGFCSRIYIYIKYIIII